MGNEMIRYFDDLREQIMNEKMWDKDRFAVFSHEAGSGKSQETLRLIGKMAKETTLKILFVQKFVKDGKMDDSVATVNKHAGKRVAEQFHSKMTVREQNAFMYQFDLIMGTSYFKRYSNSRLSTSQLMPIMAQILAKNCGILIIDEIQHLKAVRSKNSTEVLTFLTTLINTVNIPIIMVGTPKAMEVLQSQFRQARRSTNAGNVFWDRMQKDEIWDLFFRGMWKYQWTEKEAPYSEEFSSIFYDLSQGIPDISIKLYMMIQLRSISNAEEEITPQLIKRVAEEELKMVQPVLKSLRNNQQNKLIKYDDLLMPDIEKFIEKEQNVLDQREILDSLKKGVTRKDEQKKLLDDAVFRLNILGIKQEEAKKTVTEILEKEHGINDILQVVQQAYKYLTVNLNDTVENNIKDLRSIVEEGKKHDVSAYRSLVEAGVIKQDYAVSDAS